jgi:general L-amino acid transport system permease protein
VEVYLLLLAAYLSLDLLISLIMNSINRLVQIRER